MVAELTTPRRITVTRDDGKPTWTMATHGSDAYGDKVTDYQQMSADEMAGALVCGVLKPDGVPLGAQPAVIAALVLLLQAADDRLQNVYDDLSDDSR